VLGVLRNGRVRRFGAFEGVCGVGGNRPDAHVGSGRGVLVVFLCPVEGGRTKVLMPVTAGALACAIDLVGT